MCHTHAYDWAQTHWDLAVCITILVRSMVYAPERECVCVCVHAYVHVCVHLCACVCACVSVTLCVRHLRVIMKVSGTISNGCAHLKLHLPFSYC